MAISTCHVPLPWKIPRCAGSSEGLAFYCFRLETPLIKKDFESYLLMQFAERRFRQLPQVRALEQSCFSSPAAPACRWFWRVRCSNSALRPQRHWSPWRSLPGGKGHRFWMLWIFCKPLLKILKRMGFHVQCCQKWPSGRNASLRAWVKAHQ